MKTTFSQRKGLTPIAEVIQYDSMNSSLRNSLWNTLDDLFWFYQRSQVQASKARITRFGLYATINYFKVPVDEVVNASSSNILASIRKYYFDSDWHRVYDFIEFTAEYLFQKNININVYERLNETLEKELSAYRFVNGQLTDITSEQEIGMLEEATNDDTFRMVSAHLARALELYSDRLKPDYRNSIKESMSAVESMAKLITNNPKATLSDALRELEKNGNLHKALKDGFEKLYGYTSDSNGIRHAMLKDHELTQADARYFMLSCTSFVNYLKSKI